MDTRDLPPVATKAPKSPPPMYAGEAPPPGSTAPQPDLGHKPRWRRRLVFALLAVLAAGVAWGGLSAWLLSNGIDRIPAAELPSLSAPGSGPVNYLLVGSDSREGLTPELGEFFGDFDGQRTDVIMIAHVANGRLQLLSLPRDLKVDIPGYGTNRINAAFAFGGPELLVQTVQSFLGMPVHHYLEVGFVDFAHVVDSLGGVDIDFPYAARDNKSGLYVEAGTTHLEGPASVAFVRSRTYEELRDGVWMGIDQGDIGRTGRQQLVLSELVGEARSPMSFLKAPWIAASLGDSLRADERLSTIDLAKLAWAVVRSGGIDPATLPVTDSYEGGVAYVIPSEPAAADILSRFTTGRLMSAPSGDG